MQIITELIPAGVTKRFEIAGSYLEIIDALGRLNIEMTGRNGEQAEEMRGALSGFYSEEAFAGFEVGNPEAYAQTVRLMISTKRGGSRRQPGTVQVTNAVNAALATADLTAGLAIAFALDATIVTPAANANGLRIRMATVYARASAGNAARLVVVAAPAAPASLFPAASLPIVSIVTSISASIDEKSTGHINVQLPAGFGLYLVRAHEGAAATYAQAVVSYELL